MSPKAVKKAAPAKKEAPKAAKAAKGSSKAAPEMAAPAPVVSEEELEEAEESAAVAASSGGGNAAALAAATSSTEMSASFKNFRHHPDMENFYRFIYENDLRLEALTILDQIQLEKANRKSIKLSKANAH